MYAWLTYHRLHPIAATLGAILAMFCGPYFLHIYAGHLSNLGTMVWTPLIFLAIDGLAHALTQDERPLRTIILWIWLGTGSVALQVFAGHPQYVFYTGIAAGLYTLVHIRRTRRSLECIAYFIAMYGFGSLLSAIQLLPGVEAAKDSVRGAGVAYHFAAMFSFPPENLLTLIAPHFFSNMAQYWGRGFLWEMSLYTSVTGLVFAVYAAIYIRRTDNYRRIIMIFLLFLLALGSHTPLFKILYMFVPGFDSFRGNSKFIYPLILFLILLAMSGVDRLIKKNHDARNFRIAIAIGAIMTWILACMVLYSSVGGSTQGLWAAFLKFIQATRESYIAAPKFQNPEMIHQSGLNAARSLLLAGGTLLLISAFFYYRRLSKIAIYGLVALSLVEILIFAAMSRSVFPISKAYIAGINQLLDKEPGDYRILNLLGSEPNIPSLSNESLSGRWLDIWGNDPGVSRRYAEMMAFSQGIPPDRANQGLLFETYHKFLSMFRTRYVLTDYRNGRLTYRKIEKHLPRFLIIHNFIVIKDRDAALAFMSAEKFNARQTVVLEDSPNMSIYPASGTAHIRILNESTDYFTLELNTSANGVLLITDTFSNGWRAIGENHSAGKQYEVMPANYAMLGVIIPQGHHIIRLEYAPPVFVWGRTITLLAAGIYFAMLLLLIFLRYRIRAAVSDFT
jgi:hypothetical protein